MVNCIFCKIVARKSPSQILYQDKHATAFLDIYPVAPVHVLIVPNKHIASTNDLTLEDEGLIGHLFTIAQQIARQNRIERSGYRLIINTGPDGGQAVPHLHLHLIGGRRMKYPMG